MLAYAVILIMAVRPTAIDKDVPITLSKGTVVPVEVTERAPIPQEINFQGFLTDADEDTALSGNFDMVFKVYDSESVGSLLWSESWTDIAVDGGIFNVILGETQPIPDSVFLNYTDLWLELVIEGETLTPRQKIVSVGRAYKAKYAETADYATASETATFADSASVAANAYKLEENSLTDLDARWVNEGQIGSISTGMIQSGAVDSAKIAVNVVTSSHIKDGTIQQADLAFSPGDITAVTAGEGLTGGGTQGDIALNVGAGDGLVATDDSISVNVSDFAGDGLGVAKANDLNVNTGAGLEISGDAVQLTDDYSSGSAYDSRFVNEGQASSISDSMIQNSAVTSDKIADGTIISADAASDFKAPYADTADYAIAANVVSVDSATYADTADYALNAGASTTSGFADSSDASAYAYEAGHAIYADTAQYTIGGGSTAYADSAGVAAYAHEAGHSLLADTADYALAANVVSVDSSTYADTADYAINAGGSTTSDYADSAGHLVVPDSLEATVNGGLNGVLWIKNNGSGNGIMVDGAGFMGVYVMNAGNYGYNVYQAGKVGYGVQNADVGFRSYFADTGIYAAGTHLAGYFEGDVKVASNITSDEYYKGIVTADSALVTKKYVDDQAESVSYADSAGVAAYAHNSDMLDGQDASAFALADHEHVGQSWTASSGAYVLRKKIDVNSTSNVYTQVDTALNSGSGSVYGGMFYSGGTGAGSKYGLYARADGPSTPSNNVYGIGIYADNESSGQAWGGSFYAGGSGSGIKYGVEASIYAPASSANPAYGVKGYANHFGTGSSYGGYFKAAINGTGPHYGVYAESDSFGIYAKSTSGSGNYAGYFEGNVKVVSNITSDDFYRGTVNADSALMTKKYIDQQTTTATNTGYHAPTITVSMSPDSTGDYVCDGISDEVEIQAALDSVNALGGGVVYIKYGTFNLGSNLTPDSNTTLMGTGPGSVLNRPTATAIDVNGKSRVVIEKLRITGGCTQGIQFYDVTDGEIKQCWIESSGTYGIYLSGSGGINNSHYNVVANNICSGSGYRIYIQGYENVIQGNNCRDGYISLSGAESNVVVGNVVQGGGYGIRLQSNSMDNTVTGNTLIEGTLQVQDSDWNVVSSNTIFESRIHLLSGSEWNVISGNIIRDYGGTGLHMHTSDYNTISSNIVNNASAGIYVGYSSNNTITDNVCSNNSADGIYITGDSDYNVVNDNRCVNNTNYGIRIGSGTENVVQNNMLQGNTAGSYTDGGTNTRDDDAGATGGVGGHITNGTANYE